jgi:iron complex transport system ATP-binding protein
MRASVVGTDIVIAYGTRVAVAKSNFHVPAGGITAIIGPNGSGKSTLMGAIAGLIDLDSGTITYPNSDKPRISYVLQTTKVNEALPITVREVVTMGRYADVGITGRIGDADRKAVERAMTRTSVNDISGRQLHHLSGGQRQRVFVAQGLAQDHDILLLDEPMTGVDLTAARAIDVVIHDEVSEGCSVVITTHDLSEARVADHVILIAGKVLAEGPPADVLTTGNLADAYGASLLHLDGDIVIADDPAHDPVPGRHVHRTKTMPEHARPYEVDAEESDHT